LFVLLPVPGTTINGKYRMQVAGIYAGISPTSISYITTSDVFNTMLIDTSDAFIDCLISQSIVYYPAGGGTRTIDAIVDYAGIGGLSGVPHGSATMITISVKNSDSEGIATDEVDIGGDYVLVPDRVGKDAQSKRLTGIANEDSGMVMYEVR